MREAFPPAECTARQRELSLGLMSTLIGEHPADKESTAVRLKSGGQSSCAKRRIYPPHKVAWSAKKQAAYKTAAAWFKALVKAANASETMTIHVSEGRSYFLLVSDYQAVNSTIKQAMITDTESGGVGPVVSRTSIVLPPESHHGCRKVLLGPDAQSGCFHGC